MPDPGSRTRKSWWRRLLPLAVIAVFCAALWALDREINRFHLADFLAYLRELAWWKLALAVAATAAGYAILIGYDWFALRYVHHHLALRRVAFTAFIGYAFSLNIGQTVLSGGAVRMRLYTRWGLGPGDVTRIMGFNYVIGLVGQFLLAGLLFVLVGVRLPDYLPAPFRAIYFLAPFLIAIVLFGVHEILQRRKR